MAGFLIGTFVLFNACTDKFEEYNTDERGITSEQEKGDKLNRRGKFTQIQQMIYCNFNCGSGVNWTYQIMQNLNSDIFSGYMMTPTPFASNRNNTTYALVDSWNGAAWDNTYAYFMTVVKSVEDISKEEEATNFLAYAKILKVLGMHRISDLYGPIIYTHYGDSKTGGEYDSQEEAYNAFFIDLNEAIVILSNIEENNIATTPLGKYDQLFNGDNTQWIQLANSLRLRLAMRISNVKPVKAKLEAELAVANKYGLLSVDVAVKDRGYQNPLAAIANSWGDIRMGAPIESILLGYNDPRISKYFLPAEDKKVIDKGYTYKGIRQGIELVDKAEYVNHSSINLTIESPAILMTIAETYFLRAEAALRGWSMGGTAKDLYEGGIKASMRQWDVSVGDYLTSSAIPNDFTDILKTNGENDIANVNMVSPAWDEATTDEERLQKIITQKWIAIFPEGLEAWTEVRRTGYPKLFPVVENKSGGIIPEGTFVNRLNFAVSEKSNNPSGYQKAVELLGGVDTGATKLWWDVN